MPTIWFFDFGKASIGEAMRDLESKRAEPRGSAHLKENAFEPVCPPGGQGNGLRYLTLS